MDERSPSLGMAQERRLRRRFVRVIGIGMLSTILALGRAHACGWSVLTGIMLGSMLGEIGLAGLFVGVGCLIVWILTHAGKAQPSLLHLLRINAPAEEVVFPDGQREHLVHGLYFPQSEFAPTILVSSGFRRDITDVLKTSTFLWWAGYQVLAFEYHGHGPRSAGVPVTLGHRELDDFMGALTYARQRDHTTHLGAVGYSMGAAVTIVGAARCQEIEAAVADSSFASVWSAVEVSVRRIFHLHGRMPAWILHLLYLVTDALLWRQAGFHFHEFAPQQEIMNIAPRPVLLIHGSADTIVSPADATTLYSLAGEGRALWLIPGTLHTTGHLVERTAHEARVLTFFGQAFRHTLASPVEVLPTDRTNGA